MTPTAAGRGCDRGYVLPAAVVTLTLLAITSALTARVFGELLRASVRERVVIENQAAAHNAKTILDAWMADPAASAAITDPDHDDHGDYTAAAFTGGGADGCVLADETCWRIALTRPNPAVLRGGEARQDLAEVTLTVESGCSVVCQYTSQTVRTYERAVFAHYQLHYQTDLPPPDAFTSLKGPDGEWDTPLPPACETDPDGVGCDKEPDDHPNAAATRHLEQARVVFTGLDVLNGPLRHSGNDPVRYCGSPRFRRIETRTSTAPKPAAPTCTGKPGWYDNADALVAPWPVSGDPNRDLPADRPRWVVRGDNLELPPLGPPPTTGRDVCSLLKIEHPSPHPLDIDADKNRATNCPDEPGSSRHAIRDGDIITASGDITIHRLDIAGSITVYARGDIIICGLVEATGTNPAGGPNVVALVTHKSVVLQPSPTPAGCETGAPRGDGTVPQLAAGSAHHDLTLDNVAVLAPNSGVYATGWHLPCNGPCPTLTINGSIAAKHLGLYGTPDPGGAGATHGWKKHFTYPEDFWQARPPWWPNLPPGEWTHLR